MNVLVMISYIHKYMYVYMKCVLTNDFMRSASPDSVHCRVGLGSVTRPQARVHPKNRACSSVVGTLPATKKCTFKARQKQNHHKQNNPYKQKSEAKKRKNPPRDQKWSETFNGSLAKIYRSVADAQRIFRRKVSK